MTSDLGIGADTSLYHTCTEQTCPQACLTLPTSLAAPLAKLSFQKVLSHVHWEGREGHCQAGKRFSTEKEQQTLTKPPKAETIHDSHRVSFWAPIYCQPIFQKLRPDGNKKVFAFGVCVSKKVFAFGVCAGHGLQPWTHNFKKYLDRTLSD